MGTHDHSWAPMIIHYHSWVPKITHDHPWALMITHDYQWAPRSPIGTHDLDFHMICTVASDL